MRKGFFPREPIVEEELLQLFLGQSLCWPMGPGLPMGIETTLRVSFLCEEPNFQEQCLTVGSCYGGVRRIKDGDTAPSTGVGNNERVEPHKPS